MLNALMNMMTMMASEAVTPLHDAVKIALIVLVSLSAVILVIIILMQPGNSQGLGEIAGGSSESYLGKNRSKTVEGKLKKLTVVLSIFFVLCILALSIVMNVVF